MSGKRQYTFGDLGGGLGIHFDLIRNYLPKEEIPSYNIIETPSLCKAYSASTLNFRQIKNYTYCCVKTINEELKGEELKSE